MPSLIFSVAILTALAASPLVAEPLFEGLKAKCTLRTCSQSTGQCTEMPIAGLRVEALDNSASVGVGLGGLIAKGTTEQDGSVEIALPPETYQGQAARVNGTCAYGWMPFGEGCLGPKFVVTAGSATHLTLRYTQWVE
jgi:hypothetical protein